MPPAPKARVPKTRALSFHAPDRAAWTAWLEVNHAKATAVSLVFYRKAAGRPSITYDEAVEEALCFGWIDGVKHRLDDRRYTYRFSPRRANSKWSALNKQRLTALEAAGKMRPAGTAAVAAAKASGAWTKPARAEVPATIPAELAAALAKSAGARKAFEALPPGRKRQLQRWVHEAKQTETRARRAAQVIEKLA
jgi:uncharacterized protein YdeI (YjbR/CyaY-like superfamily)